MSLCCRTNANLGRMNRMEITFQRLLSSGPGENYNREGQTDLPHQNRWTVRLPLPLLTHLSVCSICLSVWPSCLSVWPTCSFLKRVTPGPPSWFVLWTLSGWWWSRRSSGTADRLSGPADCLALNQTVCLAINQQWRRPWPWPPPTESRPPHWPP